MSIDTTQGRIVKPQAVSGYPEWLPEIRLVEQHWIDQIRKSFESFGFANIETPSVEALEVLLSKGETDKEIYTLTRLQAGPDDREARLGLHFDLTVPMARYVAQHFNDLDFPFKRYQIQRAWRGERPQEGRFREFYQCDIDVINVDHLPLHFDAEMPAIIIDILHRLDIGQVRLHISNRKILDGYLQGLGLNDVNAAIRVLDKLDKIGPDGVKAELVRLLGLGPNKAAQALALAGIRRPDDSFLAEVKKLGIQHPLLDQGLAELAFVMSQLAHLPRGAVVADLSVARGFDYYTGTVYEAKFVEWPDYPTIVAGGRYDDLASAYINKKLPGVGISIGLTRIFAKLVAEGRISAPHKCPTRVLVVLPGEDRRAEAAAVARGFRARGIAAELYHTDQKPKKQLAYAAKKGIPYVWFPPFSDGQGHEVKDMHSGEQGPADPDLWEPALP